MVSEVSIFDLEDSQVIIRETEGFSSGQGCHIADKTLVKEIKFKPKLQHLFSKREVFILWQLCWVCQVTDAGETLITRLATD